MSGLVLKAQQIPLYSQYYFNPQIYNPALSGAEGVTEASIFHRRQWSAVQGSPETSALTLNGALNKEKVGYSVYIFKDVTDIVERYGVYGSYAYHLKLSDKTILSFGLAAGVINNGINQAGVSVTHLNDPILLSSIDNRTSFDLNFGANLEVDNFQFGASVVQLLGSGINYSENFNTDVEYNLIRHFIFSAKYNIEIKGDDMRLEPMILVRASETGVPAQVDAGAYFTAKKIGWIGAMFRSGYGVTANLGYNINDKLSIGYAHDFSIKSFASSLGTSNEVMLTYRFGSNKQNERLEKEIKKIKRNQGRMQEELEETIDDKFEELKDELKTDQQNPSQDDASGDGDSQGDRGRQDGEGGDGDRQGTDGDRQTGDRGRQGGDGDRQTDDRSRQANPDFGNGETADKVTPGSPGFYLVAGVFSQKENAITLSQKIERQGYQVSFFQDRTNGYFYVYLAKFSNYNEANNVKNNRIDGSFTEELWIKEVK